MHSSTVAFSRYLESAGVAGCAVKKGSATNGVTAITSVTDKPAGIIGQTKSASDIVADGQIAAIEPASSRSENETTSALMKPFWKSVWMTPAACGAVQP